MIVYAILALVCASQTFLLVRDRIREVRRRHREPEVEAEVKRRMGSVYDPTPRPATPEVRVPSLHEWLTADPENYPVNATRVRLVATIYLAFGLGCVVSVVYAGDWGEWIGMALMLPTVAGTIWAGLYKPSLVWRVRREARIAFIARSHDAEYIVEDVPGQGWDLNQVRNRVGQIVRDWDKGVQRDGSFLPKGGSDDPAQTGGTTSVLDAKPVEAIRSTSQPYLEYGMEKFKRNVFRFYIVTGTLALPYLAVRRRMELSARRQRRLVDSSQIDQMYTVVTGCGDVFSHLSRRTKEMMVGVHVDTMVLYQGWAVLWWDGKIFGGIDFGKGQNWDGRMDLASEKTWDGVAKVRALLTSIENDMSVSGPW